MQQGGNQVVFNLMSDECGPWLRAVGLTKDPHSYDL